MVENYDDDCEDIVCDEILSAFFIFFKILIIGGLAYLIFN